MTIWHALLLGIIEGLTEFLPVSSTFHLIFASQILGLPMSDFVKVFEVAIQAGGILAVGSLFAQDILKKPLLMAKVLVSFLPTAVVGLALHKVIKNIFFESNELMVTMFIAVGVVFLLFEWWQRRNEVTGRPHPAHSTSQPSTRSNPIIKQSAVQLGRELETLSWLEAVGLGLAQALAVIPGVSRAGAVLLAGMGLGFKRSQAAYYSFLLAVPTICAAAFLDVIQMRASIGQAANGWWLLLLGGLVAFISAWIVLKWFIKYLQHHTLELFGWYRIGAGLLLAGWLWWR